MRKGEREEESVAEESWAEEERCGISCQGQEGKWRGHRGREGGTE